jgi:hypothetical protein
MSTSNTRERDRFAYFNYMLLCNEWEDFEPDCREHSSNFLLLIVSYMKFCIISAVSKYFNYAIYSKDLRLYRVYHRTIFNLKFQSSRLRDALQLLTQF